MKKITAWTFRILSFTFPLICGVACAQAFVDQKYDMFIAWMIIAGISCVVPYLTWVFTYDNIEGKGDQK